MKYELLKLAPGSIARIASIVLSAGQIVESGSVK